MIALYKDGAKFQFSFFYSQSQFLRKFISVHFGFRYEASPEADEEDEEKKGLLELDSG